MNLSMAFETAAQSNLPKTALFWGETEISYAAILASSSAIAAHLNGSLGVKPGDRVGIWLKNCPEFVPALFGILRAGAVAVPVNNFLKPQEVSYILADSGANVLIVEDAMSEAFPALSATRPGLKYVNISEFAAFASNGALPNLAERTESDLAALVYTSGTTGRPKGAMLSHGNLLHNVESCRLVLEFVDGDRMAVLLPMFHSYMLMVGVFLPLLVGGSVVLVRSLNPPRNALQEVALRKATVLPCIPQFFRAMVNAPGAAALPLRICVSGAAPMPKQVHDEFNSRFPFPLIEGYGLSEASPVVTKNPLHGVRKSGSIGLPIPNVEVTIQDDEGRMLPDGEIGELCVRGGNVMLGYWNQPAETAKAIRNGWLLTGDVAYRDQDGYFFITDRKKDMLLVNGINVYPREIEEILYQFPGIKEVSVIGVPDHRKGEQPLAYVAPNDGVQLDEKQLVQFVRERLADYKVPRHIVFMDALPRNATGKILKTRLRELAQAQKAEVSADANS